VASRILDDPQNTLLFGRVNLSLQGTQEDVSMAYSALLLLWEKLGGEALTPERMLSLLRS
jgi:hypothetical protein